MTPCPYPDCRSVVADRDEAWAYHFGAVHRQDRPHAAPLQQCRMDRIEGCKLCPSVQALHVIECRHGDPGVQMIQHIGTFHAAAVVGLNLERRRLQLEAERRVN